MSHVQPYLIDSHGPTPATMTGKSARHYLLFTTETWRYRDPVKCLTQRQYEQIFRLSLPTIPFVPSAKRGDVNIVFASLLI